MTVIIHSKFCDFCKANAEGKNILEIPEERKQLWYKEHMIYLGIDKRYEGVQYK